MKKFIKIVIVSLSVLLVLLSAGVWIFLKTLDLNRYRQRIIKTAQESLHRRVDFKDISLRVSLSEGVNLNLADFLVGEDPAFGQGDFLTAGRLELGVSLYELIFKKEIRVLAINLKSVELTLIKDKAGVLNLSTLAQSPGQKDLEPGTAAVTTSAAALPAIMINQVSFKDGRIRFIDRSSDDALTVELNKINFEATDISLRDEFRFRLQAAFLHDVPNINIEGNARVYLADQSAELTNTDLTVALSDLSLDALQKSVPALKDAALPEKLQGTLRARISQLRVSAAGLIYLNASAQLEQGRVRLAQLPAVLDDLEAELSFSEKRISIQKAGFRISEGTAEITGDIDDYLKTPSLSLKVILSRIQIADLFDQSGQDIKCRGVISSEGELKASSASGGELMDNLTGTASFTLTEGKLTDINILKLVLNKVAVIPNLAALLEAGLPDEWKQRLQKKDTVVTGVSAQARIEGQSAQVSALRLEADSFLYEGSGRVSFDQSYTIDGRFIIPREFSKSMVKAVNEMEFLRDKEGLISFPLSVSGKGGAVSFKPDIKSIGTGVIEQKGRQELQKVLDKVLNRDQQETSQPAPESTSPTNTTQTSTDTRKESLEDQLIGSVLNTIFK